jgi:hypothetical protein
MPADRSPLDDDQPDPRVLWRWAAAAARPWAGWCFIALGVLLVLLGYFGVSREAIVEKQIPYLVSGGIGGLLACILGAYFLGTEELRNDSGRLDRLEQMVEDLHAALLARPDAPAPPGRNGTGTLHAPELVVVDGGTTIHLRGCALAQGKDTKAVGAKALDGGKLQRCPLCEPLATTTA